jgi:hypothetical protein
VVVAEVFDPGVSAIGWAVDVYGHGGGPGKERPPFALRHVRNIAQRT